MDKSERITCDANNLVEAFHKTISSSKNKSETKKFSVHELDEVARAQHELSERKWKISDKRPFIISERGHVRKIQGNTPYDRMIIHSYVDNVLEPLIRPYLIYDNYASLKGKGTRLARERFEKFMHNAYRKYGNNEFYVLLIDFSKFYDNIRHDKLKELILKYFPDDDREFNEYMIDTILDSFKVDVSHMSKEEYDCCLEKKFVALEHMNKIKSGEKYMKKSLNIGNHASQIFSVLFPLPIDNYCKIVKGLKFYGRYMDDIVIIDNNKDYLKKLIKDIDKISKEQGLFVNEKKTKILKVGREFKYLNRLYRLTSSGHLEERISKETFRREIKKLRKFKTMCDAGKISKDKVENQFKSWIGNNKKLLSKYQLNYVNKIFKADWRD